MFAANNAKHDISDQARKFQMFESTETNHIKDECMAVKHLLHTLLKRLSFLIYTSSERSLASFIIFYSKLI